MRVKCTDTWGGARAIISTSTVGLPGGTRKPMRTGLSFGSRFRFHLFELDASGFEHLLPARDLAPDVRVELLRASADGERARRREAREYCLVLQRFRRRGVHAVDHGLRRLR